MRLNAISLFNKNTNYTSKAQNTNHSQVNFKRLEKDITDFTNSQEDTRRYVKTLFAYNRSVCPDNINDNFEIKKSKDGFETFKLKSTNAGNPPVVSFFNNAKDLLEHLKEKGLEYELDMKKDDTAFISYKENKMRYGIFYDKKTLKLQSAYVNTDFNKKEISLIKKGKDICFYFKHCNDSIHRGSLFSEKTIIDFDKSMKVKKSETITNYKGETTEKTAEFNQDGSIRKFNKKSEIFDLIRE